MSRHDKLGLFFCLVFFLLKCCNRSTHWNVAWGTPGLNLSENKHESSKGHPSGIHSLCVGGNVTVTEWNKWGGWDLFPNCSPVLIMTASSHSNLKVICVEGCRTVLLFLWLGLEDNWCGRVQICMQQDNRLRKSEVVGAASFCCAFTDRSARTHYELSLYLCPSLQGLKVIVVSSLHSSTSLMHVENWQKYALYS